MFQRVRGFMLGTKIIRRWHRHEHFAFIKCWASFNPDSFSTPNISDLQGKILEKRDWWKGFCQWQVFLEKRQIFPFLQLRLASISKIRTSSSYLYMVWGHFTSIQVIDPLCNRYTYKTQPQRLRMVTFPYKACYQTMKRWGCPRERR